MLTDYHVHLRSDDLSATAAEHFTAANAERYRQAASDRGIAELGVSEHIYRFTRALEIWHHPFWRAERPRRPRRLSRVRARADRSEAGDRGRLRPGRGGSHRESDRRATTSTTCLARFTSCATTRSTWTISASGARPQSRGDLAALLRDARARLPAAACSTSSPTRTSSRCGAPSARAPKATCVATTSRRSRRSPRPRIAVEVSTAGLRKRVRELYPAPAFLQECVDAGAPVALSSDAHRPEDVGADYDQALELLERARRRRAVRVRAPRRGGSSRSGRSCDDAAGIGYDSPSPRSRPRRLILGGVERPGRARPRRALRRGRADATP